MRKFLGHVGIKTQHGMRLTLRGIAVIAITVSAWSVAILINEGSYSLSSVPFAVLLLTTLFEVIMAERVAEYSYPYETQRKVEILTRAVGETATREIAQQIDRSIRQFSVCDPDRISGTVHVIVDLPPSPERRGRVGLLQLTDYIGNGEGKGRVVTLNQGIVGRCARSGRIEHVNFSDQTDYELRMVSEFGFSKRETETHTTTGRSYLALPLCENQETVGVLYFYSTEPQVFPHAASSMDLARLGGTIESLLRVVRII